MNDRNTCGIFRTFFASRLWLSRTRDSKLIYWKLLLSSDRILFFTLTYGESSQWPSSRTFHIFSGIFRDDMYVFIAEISGEHRLGTSKTFYVQVTLEKIYKLVKYRVVYFIDINFFYINIYIYNQSFSDLELFDVWISQNL